MDLLESNIFDPGNESNWPFSKSSSKYRKVFCSNNCGLQPMTEKVLFQIIRISERTCSLRLY